MAPANATKSSAIRFSLSFSSMDVSARRRTVGFLELRFWTRRREESCHGERVRLKEGWRIIPYAESGKIGDSIAGSPDIGCSASGMPIWLSSNFTGYTVKEWRCIPEKDVETFMKNHERIE